MSLFQFFRNPPVATVTVNGARHQGSNLTVTKGRVLVDGRNVTPASGGLIHIEVTGNVDILSVDACERLRVSGTAHSVRTSSGDVTIAGNVAAEVTTASGDVLVKGTIGGGVRTVSGDVSAAAIQGSVATVCRRIIQLNKDCDSLP